MRVSLIYNSKAGGAPARRDLLALLKEAGYDVAHCVGKKDDWSAMLEDPGSMIVVAGGDGTIGAAARRLIRRDVPIAILPLGTANNIGRTLGIDGSPPDIIASWATARRYDMDLGIARGPWGKSWFVEGFGLGLLATAMTRLRAQDRKSSAKRDDRDFKLFRDHLALSGLAAEYPPLVLEGRLDDEELSGEFLLLEAMNTRAVGPGLKLAPEADPADGHLDFVVLPADARAAFIDYLSALREGQPAILPLSARRGRRLRLAGNGYDAHVDDRVHRPEPAPPDAHLDIEIEVDVRAVQMLVPFLARAAEAVPAAARGSATAGVTA